MVFDLLNLKSTYFVHSLASLSRSDHALHTLFNLLIVLELFVLVKPWRILLLFFQVCVSTVRISVWKVFKGNVFLVEFLVYFAAWFSRLTRDKMILLKLLGLALHAELTNLTEQHLVVAFFELQPNSKFSVLLNDFLNVQVERLHLSLFHFKLASCLIQLLHHVVHKNPIILNILASTCWCWCIPSTLKLLNVLLFLRK